MQRLQRLIGSSAFQAKPNFFSPYVTVFLLALVLANPARGAMGISRIVGGVPATPGEWPWMVSLSGENNEHYCGASLIAPGWVLSAAHCFDNNSPQGLFVRIGLQNQDDTEGVERIAVTQIILHERFNEMTMDNDIALVRLGRNSSKTPVRLLTSEQERALLQDGTQAVVKGWGFTSDPNINDDAEESHALRKAVIQILARDECNQRNRYDNDVTENMICAGNFDGGVDSCQGDSGGPLAIESGRLWYQVGITSWGEGCAERNYPGVYTRIANYSQWIEDQMARPFDPTNAPIANDSGAQNEPAEQEGNSPEAEHDQKHPATLLAVQEEGPGVNCQYGGQKIQAGFDANFNGELDADEVAKTEYTCLPGAPRHTGEQAGGCNSLPRSSSNLLVLLFFLSLSRVLRRRKLA